MRHRSGRVFLGSVVSLGIVGCGLLVDVDGLSGGPETPGGVTEAGAEGAVLEPLDGSTDGATCLQTSDPTLLSDAIGIGAGLNFTCAVRANGTVACWGDNGSAQLGSPGSDRSIPVAVPGLTGITSVVAGNEFACALDSGGHVWCWGNNDDGEMGIGASSIDHRAPAQVGVAGKLLDKVTTIAAGGRHACAISAGALYCWGANNFLQLGRTNLPLLPGLVSGITGAIDLTLGTNYSCVLADDPSMVTPKALLCWGQNNEAQLGFVGAGTKDPQRIQMRVGAKDALPLMASGFGHTCARDESNHLLCWGENDFGQLGPGLSPGAGSPVIQNMTAFGVVRTVAAGDDYTCAVETDGKVLCLGLNGEGQLGNGTRDTAAGDAGLPPHTEVTPVSGLPSVQVMSGGGAHTCAILTHPCADRGGPVMCWGANVSGQIGNGAMDRALVPVSVRAP